MEQASDTQGKPTDLLRHEQHLSEQERQEFLHTIHQASHELAKTIDVLLEGSSAHRQQKQHRQDLLAWSKQQGEIEQRLVLLRERQQAVQAALETISAAQPTIARQKQELARQQHECTAKAWACVHVRYPLEE